MLNGLITAGIDPKIAKLIPIPFIAPLSFLSLKFFVDLVMMNYFSAIFCADSTISWIRESKVYEGFHPKIFSAREASPCK